MRSWFGPAPAVLVFALVAVAMMTVGAGRASADWVSTTTGCPGGLGPPCYVYKNPEGTIVEGGKYMSTTEFENLGAETADSVIEGGHLSAPAKAVIEQPGFDAELLSSADSADGVVAGSDVAVEAASIGLLPVVSGAVLAFTAGYGVGTAICGIFGGCTDVESTEEGHNTSTGGEYEYPYEVGEGEWIRFPSSSPCASGFATCHWPGVYYWQQKKTSGGHAEADTALCYRGYGGCSGPESLTAPGLSGVDLESVATGGKYYGLAYRALLQGRHVFSSEKKPSGFTEQTFTPSSEWSQKASTAMRENPATDGHQVVNSARFVASKISGSHVANPYSLSADVPDCSGLLYAGCAKLVEEAGLKPTHKELGWEKAVTSDPPEEVEELSPAKATEVERGSSVTVTTNPEESGMPVVIPSPGADETYSEYVATLNPALSPHEHILGEVAENPAYGPNAVTGTSPVAGTRVDPATSTALSVDVNPAGAPEASTSPTSGWSPPAISAVSLAPFASVHIGCSSFPFGIFCWLKDGLTSWGPGGECPDLSLPFVSFGSGEDHFSGTHLETSTCGFEPAMEIIRPMLVVLACISLAAMFAYAALGIGGQGGGDD